MNCTSMWVGMASLIIGVAACIWTIALRIRELKEELQEGNKKSSKLDTLKPKTKSSQRKP